MTTKKRKFELEIPKPTVGDLLMECIGNPFYAEAEIPAVVERLRQKEKLKVEEDEKSHNSQTQKRRPQ